MTIEWKPWETFRQDQELLPITEPPCKGCKFFRPRRQYETGGRFSGVVICEKIGEQCNDFSCFEAR